MRGRADRPPVGLVVLAFGALAALTCLLAPLVGSTHISLARALDRSVPFADNVDAQIFFIARLPRVLAAALVGASLAAAGAVFQALLRNPLASADTLGVSGGAAIGAIAAITFHANFTVFGIAPVPIASLAGSLGALVVVYALAAARRRGLSATGLLLAGIALNAFFAAIVLFVQSLASVADTFRTVRWLMGSLDIGGYAPIVGALPLVAIAGVAVVSLPRALDLMSLGSDAAAARGVNVRRTEQVALVSASLATGAAVSVGGPVSFIGIVVPHLVRLIVGSDHRVVLPAAALFGAMFLVGCDLLSRTVFSPIDLPVGIVTAVIGAPFFLWLLVRRS
ncbi:MAG: FecCD family ABC transporter permease [Betaproteobacteria bacterium]